MSTFIMPILLVFGSGGNILNAIIFLQKTLRSCSCSMYMIAAYFLHTIVLCFAMSTTLYSLNHRDPLTYSVPYCKIRQYLISAIFTMARCCVGMACVDRYAITSQNTHIRAFGRPHIARFIIITIIIVWLILPVHLIIYNTIQNSRCIMPGLYPYFFAAYAIIIAAIIPPSMMITFSILAAKNIRQMRRRIQPSSMDTIVGNSNIHLKQYDYQLLKMLFIDVIIYCISAIPSPIYYIYAAITLQSIKTAEQIAWQNFFSYLAYQFLLYIAASTSLYTNLLVSKAFRKEFQVFMNRFIVNEQQFFAVKSNKMINNNSFQTGQATIQK
ncbi:unnamed protein product [Adineta steineri]|uniref:G-protein coupled receptors family 1 profile domain-containing protein n=1 Tax=Adineta steineri TaxID=433720 RepID=A0A815ERV4_9BILA|nr:unnamed protein product [Adineta steineri]CAF1260113.1 unnamed protein product [Adineta steineri]CAF1316086.1 unnamed protein product [Adineta steineri]